MGMVNLQHTPFLSPHILFPNNMNTRIMSDAVILDLHITLSISTALTRANPRVHWFWSMSQVKGNWERRAERAAKRREENKAAKEAREKGMGPVNSADVLARLMSDTDHLVPPSEREDVTIWLQVDDDTQRQLCNVYLRNGDCPLKHCKYAHTFTLTGYVDLQMADDSVAPHPVPALERASLPFPKPSKGVASRLRFVALKNRIVFDNSHPQVWRAFAPPKRLRMKQQEEQERNPESPVADRAGEEGSETMDVQEGTGREIEETVARLHGVVMDSVDAEQRPEPWERDPHGKRRGKGKRKGKQAKSHGRDVGLRGRKKNI